MMAARSNTFHLLLSLLVEVELLSESVVVSGQLLLA